MRIQLFVSKLYGGGAERVATLWANGFISRGHDVEIVVKTRSVSASYPLSDEVTLYNIWSNWKWFLKKYLNKGYSPIREIRKAVLNYKPDVIICVIQPWGEWVLTATHGMHIPIINTEHSTFEKPDNAVYGQLTKKRLWWKYELNKKFDCVTVLTEADKVCTKGILSNVIVLPNPLAFTPAESVPPKEKYILAAGRLDVWHYKGFDILTVAWCGIAAKYPDWKLIFCGKDGNGAQDYLYSIAKEMNAQSQIEFWGFQDNMLPIYEKSSIFVLSSRYEGFGMVLIEAMSQGCAPIACDYKGRQSEIIKNENEGIICPTEDQQALANAISRLIEDETFRMTVQKNAIERARHFELNHIMDLWQNIFEERLQ